MDWATRDDAAAETPFTVTRSGDMYRPSAVPSSSRAALPTTADGKLGPSTLEAKRALLARLQMTERSLEDGTEQLREWLSSSVLNPLLRALSSTHTAVTDAAARLGWQGIQLQPLGRGGLQRNQADDEVVVGQLREQLLTRVRSLGGMQVAPEVSACLEATNAYGRLSALLRGEAPAGLLPPTPQAYIVDRVQELAAGSCMKAFEWSGGGHWGGKPWSSELPTDSALVFYLFAAFLAAPQWLFTQEDATAISGLSGTLYLGKLPSKPVAGWVGVLPSRPPPSPKGTALVGLQLATQQPLLALIVAGESLYAASGATALLQVLLLFLQLCDRELDGSLGGRHLHHLQLDAVLKAAQPRFDIVGDTSTGAGAAAVTGVWSCQEVRLVRAAWPASPLAWLAKAD
ncbi:hypothetical protein D9Q98_004567 [Chlorella vulgaris]|uniref:Uncharacterized protein n=1 Tax=Chlorella vulgaris TaxID=3077 RepID=A0A9D4TPV2_CHLVU|nr:hypothetical protein D9Q98_004567 [Chlorella vulgaris]